MDDSDFQLWLTAGGIDPATVGDDFPELWARFESWQRRSDPPREVIVVMDVDAERWPMRTYRTEVTL